MEPFSEKKSASQKSFKKSNAMAPLTFAHLVALNSLLEALGIKMKTEEFRSKVEDG